MNRRTLLRRTALLGTVGLAGCTSDDAGSTTSETTDGGMGDGQTTAMDDSTTVAGEETSESTTASMDDSTTVAGEETSESTTGTATATEEQTDDSSSGGAKESITVTVGANGKARFTPESFTLVQGGTVTWKWAAGGHNVIPDSKPDGASFEGSPGGKSETKDAGFSYSQTFETAGEYTYYCSVHRSIGMEGSFTVE